MVSTVINYIQPSELVHYSKCLELYWFSSWLGNLWPLGGHKHSEGGSQQSTPPPDSFLSFFSTCFEIGTWNLVYKSGSTTHRVWVSSQSGLCLWRVFQTFFSKCFDVSIWKLFHTVSRLHTLHQNGVPVTVCMFLAYAQLTNKAVTDAGRHVYQAVSDCYCLNYVLVIFSPNCTCTWRSCSIMKKNSTDKGYLGMVSL